MARTIASPTWRTWVWASSGSWWWTGKPGLLQSMGSQRVGHPWKTELNCCLSINDKQPSHQDPQLSRSFRSPGEGKGYLLQYSGLENSMDSSLVAQRLKRLPGMRENWVRSLGWEDPLGKEMATHSSTLAWKIPWTEETGRLQSMGVQRVGHNWTTG